MGFSQLTDTIHVEPGKHFASFVSGKHNEQRISLKYFYNETLKTAYALVSFGKLAQGPPMHAHGGAISAVFDELMGVCCWVNGYPAMTAQYTTRFFLPVPLDREVLFCGDIKLVDENKIKLRAKLINTDGVKYAEARGLFILQDLKTFEKMGQETPASFDHLKKLSNLKQQERT